MPESNIAILANPVSFSKKAAKIYSEIKTELIQLNKTFTFFQKQWPQDLSEFSDVWIIGGDGTINYFINHYPYCKIPLSIFKGGTGNDFAFMLYGNISVKEQIKKIFSSEIKFVDAAFCNDKLFINCAGIGFEGEILASMKTIRFIGGHVGYLLLVIKKIFFFKEYLFEINTNGFSVKEKFLLLMIANTKRAGGGFYIAPNASVTDGLLNLVAVKALSVFKRLIYLPVIEKGKHLGLSFVNSSFEDKISIKAEKVMAVQIDGELLYYQDVEIQVLPCHFKFKY